MRKYTSDTQTLPLVFDYRVCAKCKRYLSSDSFTRTQISRFKQNAICKFCSYETRRGHIALNKINVDENALRWLYVDKKLSAHKCAKELGLNVGVVFARLRSMGLTRRCGNQSGFVPHNKGKQTTYRYVRLTLSPDHPYYCMADLRGSIFEHRLKMAEHIGRPLEKWELVHHINHIRNDNRIENLEIIPSIAIHNGETFTHKELMMLKAENQKLRQANEKPVAFLKAMGAWREEWAEEGSETEE